MKIFVVPSFIALYFLWSWQLQAEPTVVRKWESTAGTSIEASATKVENGKVFLKAAENRVVEVPLEKFVTEDQEFLKEHFAINPPEPGQPTTSAASIMNDGLSYPAGKVSGPIDAGEGSHYFVYVPKVLRSGRKAPLMLITDWGGGKPGLVKQYAEAAEVAGWIIAISVESRNGQSYDICHAHTKRCLAHLLDALPIDSKRVYFSGKSGGGAMAFYNLPRIESAGIMPIVGFSREKKYGKNQYCFGMGGARDFNRYLTASAAAGFGDRGVHRVYPGGHNKVPAWIGNEGIVWLNGRYLGDRRGDSELDDDRLDFEVAVIDWARKLREKEPYRAHYWCHFLKEEYKIEGPNTVIVQQLLDELSGDPKNLRYTEGLAAIDGFSDSYYAAEGNGGGSAHKHTTPRIEKAGQKLAAEYVGVPLIEEITAELGLPTEK